MNTVVISLIVYIYRVKMNETRSHRRICWCLSFPIHATSQAFEIVISFSCNSRWAYLTYGISTLYVYAMNSSEFSSIIFFSQTMPQHKISAHRAGADTIETLLLQEVQQYHSDVTVNFETLRLQYYQHNVYYSFLCRKTTTFEWHYTVSDIHLIGFW